MMELFDFLRDRLSGTLRLRASDYRGSGEGTYEPIVHYGQVAEKIAAVLKERTPDLAIFGRHQRARLRPFGIGKVPFAAMLADSPAVLMIP